MQFASHGIDVAQAGVVLTPVVLLAAAAIWLLLATGVAGRIAQYFEELPHRQTARAALATVPASAPQGPCAAASAPTPAVMQADLQRYGSAAVSASGIPSLPR